ncbi:hypothetical protein [Chitinophaga nivalis]|uniref:Uncharacterized protein n=1 Tax=Chitinophaga nivalis TaxID=2991709 RepID=A0ABT3IIL5_9BACT|nr:hypothetical protein [Chitinophaga nivalis]MCW3466530.1 hypothetical protein [Chitinophaga nivalis]MCW3483779.1 hypothetical protein [Chitinophaga nivalis]
MAHHNLFNITTNKLPDRPYFLKMQKMNGVDKVKLMHSAPNFDSKAGKWIEKEEVLEVTTEIIVDAMEDHQNKVQPGDTVNFQGPGKYLVEEIIDRWPSKVIERLPFSGEICQFKVKLISY